MPNYGSLFSGNDKPKPTNLEKLTAEKMDALAKGDQKRAQELRDKIQEARERGERG